MDKKHPEARQVRKYQAGNREYMIRLQAYSKFQHPRSRLELWRIRWKVYLWQELHQSTLILPPRYNEKRRQEIVTH